MIRTAEQILKDNNVTGMIEYMIPIINEARIECIKECADIVDMDTHQSYAAIDRESILKLIDEIQ